MEYNFYVDVRIHIDFGTSFFLLLLGGSWFFFTLIRYFYLISIAINQAVCFLFFY